MSESRPRKVICKTCSNVRQLYYIPRADCSVDMYVRSKEWKE